MPKIEKIGHTDHSAREVVSIDGSLPSTPQSQISMPEQDDIGAEYSVHSTPKPSIAGKTLAARLSRASIRSPDSYAEFRDDVEGAVGQPGAVQDVHAELSGNRSGDDVEGGETLQMLNESHEKDFAETPKVNLPADLYTLTWLDLLEPRVFNPSNSTCQRSMMVARSLFKVLFVFLLQTVLIISLWQATVVNEQSDLSSLTATFEDVVGNTGVAGLQLLGEDEATEICGDIGDDYNDDGFFSYNKLPNENWDVFQVTSDKRSKLEDSIFMLTFSSRYTLLFFFVGCMWWITLLAEGNDIRFFAYAIFGSETIVIAGKEYNISEQRLARYGGASIVGLRIIVLALLTVGGCSLLINIHDMGDLVLNGVALAFIVTTDEVLFQILASDIVKDAISGADLSPKRLSPFLQKCQQYISESRYLWTAVVSVLGVIYMRVTQVMAAQKMFFVTASMCLFGGPTPNIASGFDAVFPVPGFCESMLGLECRLPGNWMADQCLRSQPTTDAKRGGCRFYDGPDSPPTWFPVYIDPLDVHSTIPEWYQEHKIESSTYFCKLAEDGSDVSSIDLEPSAYTVLGVMGNPMNLLKNACLAMWPRNPAIEVDFSDLEFFTHDPDFIDLASKNASASNLNRFASHQKNGIIPFARMRNYARGSDKFAGPFSCRWSEGVDSLLLYDFEDAATPEQLVSNWYREAAATLEDCGSLVVMKPQGNLNELCYSPFHCKSQFCDHGSRLSVYVPPAWYGTWGMCKQCPATKPEETFLDLEYFRQNHSVMELVRSPFESAFKPPKGAFEHAADVILFAGRFNDRYSRTRPTPYCQLRINVWRSGKWWSRVFQEFLYHSKSKIQELVKDSCEDWMMDFIPTDMLFCFVHKPTNITITPSLAYNGSSPLVSSSIDVFTPHWQDTVFVMTVDLAQEKHLNSLPDCEWLRTDLWQASRRTYFVQGPQLKSFEPLTNPSSQQFTKLSPGFGEFLVVNSSLIGMVPGDTDCWLSPDPPSHCSDAEGL